MPRGEPWRRGDPSGQHWHGAKENHGHAHRARRGCHPGASHGRRRPWGLRRRLTFLFAFVALAAVGLTTWLTLGAVFSAQQELFGGQGPAVGQQAPAPPWRSGGGWTGPGSDTARAAFHRIRGTALVAALLSAGLAVVAAALTTRFLTRPLLALTEGARRLEAGERGLRLQVPPAKDELRVLTEAFNNLVASLERQESWRRSMVADIAHDLRTPLAVLRSELEAMQDGLASLDEAGIGRLHAEVMMLSRLVDDLRTLSLAEASGLSLQLEPTRVEPVLRRTLETFRFEAERAGVEISLAPVPPNLIATFDADRISQVLGNLMDNALRYGGASGVELGAAHDDTMAPDGVRLWVRDHGPGLPEEALERVFERFFRGDRSRTRARTTGGGGSGLGLAIARAIADLHGGRLEAANHPEGGAVFTLFLPGRKPPVEV